MHVLGAIEMNIIIIIMCATLYILVSYLCNFE